MLSFQIFLCAMLFASAAFGQQSGPSCSNSNLLMTPAFRQQVLNYVNAARNKLKMGQLNLENGEYALIPITMPDLTWNCEDEEDLHYLARGICSNGPINPVINPANFTWYTSTAMSDHASIVTAGLEYIHIAGHYANFLSQHTICTGSGENTAISVYHDKAETIACALYDCYALSPDADTGIGLPGIPINTFYVNYFYCKITPEVEFGEKVYEVSNPWYPSQDVICPESYKMDTALRQMIVDKTNAVRRKIKKGMYLLENGWYALKAVNMPILTWDCDEEAAVRATLIDFGCPIPSDPATVFQTLIPYAPIGSSSNALKAAVSNALDQIFFNNPNLNFLASTTIYSSQYPAALALSDQATVIGCAIKLCFDPVNLITNFNFVCRAKPSTIIYDQLYQTV